MQLNNPFQMNNWEIRKFLKVVLAIQLALWGAISLDFVGIQIPIIRQLIGFIYLTFIPGIIILRILKLHKLGNIETLLYTVGLSIATLMFTGLLMNTVYPLFGISGPISITPLIITISFIVLALCVLSYIRDKDFSNPSFIDIEDILSPPALFLCLIPFLAIFGTYLINFYHKNILLMFLIIILALIVVLIAFDKFIPKNLYPLAVFVIAISLLYHRWLISMYLGGADVHVEYYLCNLVETNGIWDPTIPNTYNAMLSIVMLAPFYSIISNMDMIWVFKIIYPLLFSLVPLGLYRVFQKQIGDKIAFLSCFFFVSFCNFWIVSSRRQSIAEFFLVLLILAMIDKDMNKIKRSFLFIVFGISLAVSHYGTSYIYMFCLISAWLILFFMDSPAAQKLGDNFHAKFDGKWKKPAGNPNSLNAKNRTISSTFVLLFITFTLTWYMYVSSSSAFNAIVRIGDHVASSIFTDFLNPEAAQGLSLIMRETVSPLHSVFKYQHLLFQFFIFVGVLTLLFKRGDTKFEREYEAFSLLFFAICLGGIALPHFASALAADRLYHITLIFLAPFCVIGGITVFRVLSKIVKTSWTDQRVRSSLKVLSMFLVIFLLFNTGFVYEVTKDHPGSVALSQEWIKESGDAKTKIGLYGGFVTEQTVFGTQWLSKTINRENIKIYSDKTLRRRIVGYGSIPEESIRPTLSNTTKIRSGEYVYLGYLNVVEGLFRSWESKHLERTVYYNSSDISPLLEEMYKIYSNGGSEIYYMGEK